jgi:hypothetical protein
MYNVIGFNFCRLGMGTQMKKCIIRLEVTQESSLHHEDEEYQKWYKENRRKDTPEKAM